jgi:hypothetical protein
MCASRLSKAVKDRKFEHSPLSGIFSHAGEQVDVEIYCYAGTQDPWQLVVVDLSSGRPTAWAETFASDQKAYNAFITLVEANGMVAQMALADAVATKPREISISEPLRLGPSGWRLSAANRAHASAGHHNAEPPLRPLS